MKRMDDKTWKEAVDDAHARPWWVDALIAEAKRARESEAGLLEALEGMADELSGWSDDASPRLACAMADMARKAMDAAKRSKEAA